MEKQSIEAEYFYRLRDISKLKPENIIIKLQEFLKTLKPTKSRTSQQNRAIYQDCGMIAKKLNDAGLEIPKVVSLYMNIPFTAQSVKELLWKPTQALSLQKESTTQLDKYGEIEEIHGILMRELAQTFFLEYHEFPYDIKKRKEFEQSLENQVKGSNLDYPDYQGEPLF